MHNPGYGIRLRGFARTSTGKVRDNNEDNVHLWIRDDRVLLAVVADGMGGAVAGEEASRIAVEAIQEGMTDFSHNPDSYDTMDNQDVIDRLKTSIYSANVNIVDQASAHPELKGMGTTITLAFMRNDHVIIGHVGDSRAYLVDGHETHIHQITSDHSFVQALVAAGHISEEEAEDHPMRNVLYRALGQARDVEIDVYFEKVRAGDTLVLCSDGLTLHVRPKEIAKVAASEDDPSVCSERLIEMANQRGGRDNVSVIVIKVEADETAILDEDTVEADNQDNWDSDTVIMRDVQGFASSESSSPIQQENRDDPQLRLEQPVCQVLGEGFDKARPDQ